MDKRYQVFISSTYLDLREERQAVSQALLRSDCFPAQMENWGAMDAEQMEAIKPIIDESDYFLVISAGKYGSIHPETGLSYTEMEYDYAMSIGKPIIRLLHNDPFNALTGKQIESKAGVRKKLEAFRGKLGDRVVYATWENADQLEKETVFALIDIKKRKPSIGWVKATGQATLEVEKQLSEQKLRVAEMELAISKSPEKRFSAANALDTFFGTESLVHHLTEVRTSPDYQQISVSTHELKIEKRRLSVLISIAVLDHDREFSIQACVNRVLSDGLWPERAEGQYIRTEWDDDQAIEHLLLGLEAVGVVDSWLVNVEPHSQTVKVWGVAGQAKREISRLAVEERTKTPPLSAP